VGKEDSVKKKKSPKEGAIVLDEDFGIFVKDSQYMQDMVGKHETINKKKNNKEK
jgi:hypothetical protein